MPVFDFQCSACGLIFEALVKKNEEAVHCLRCGKKNSGKASSKNRVIKHIKV